MIEKNDNKKTVVVALSGGVDSSVTCLLLKNQGYNVVALHMLEQNAEQEAKDKNDIISLCKLLDIKCEFINYNTEMEQIKEYFITEYKKGRTPNPCVMCNKTVKFKPFVEFAEKNNADYFATGHYAIVERKNGIVYLKKAKDSEKDQTYFLNQLSSKQLEKALFPLGEMTKEQVREIAQQNNLCSAHKKDSFDVCFIGNQKFRDYIKNLYKENSGKIIDIETNKVVGDHNGITMLTLGQRKGLDIGGQKDKIGRWFVVKKDLENNILYVSTNEEKYLYTKSIIVKNINYLISKDNKFDCEVKIRYRQQDQKAHITKIDENAVKIDFEQKQRAVALGQYAVLYDNDYLIGGGVIDQILE